VYLDGDLAFTLANVVAPLFYAVATLLVYDLLKPVNRGVSLLAAFFKSTFLPRILGVLMMFAGLGWLTFLSAPLARYLAPYNMFPGMLGEGLLLLWLLVFGVNEQRWKQQARAD